MTTMKLSMNYYRAKYWHPNIPFYLQDENGDTDIKFGWKLDFMQYVQLEHYNDTD